MAPVARSSTDMRDRAHLTLVPPQPPPPTVSERLGEVRQLVEEMLATNEEMRAANDRMLDRLRRGGQRGSGDGTSA